MSLRAKVLLAAVTATIAAPPSRSQHQRQPQPERQSPTSLARLATRLDGAGWTLALDPADPTTQRIKRAG